MAGYYSDPLLLSVWLEKNSNGPKHTVEIAAAVNGCKALVTNLIWERDYESLPRNEQMKYITDRIQSAAQSIQDYCKTTDPKSVPVSELPSLFSVINAQP